MHQADGADHPVARCRYRGAARVSDRKFIGLRLNPESPYGYPDFARENNNRPIDRQPLNPPSDLGGAPTKFPLY